MAREVRVLSRRVILDYDRRLYRVIDSFEDIAINLLELMEDPEKTYLRGFIEERLYNLEKELSEIFPEGTVMESFYKFKEDVKECFRDIERGETTKEFYDGVCLTVLNNASAFTDYLAVKGREKGLFIIREL